MIGLTARSWLLLGVTLAACIAAVVSIKTEIDGGHAISALRSLRRDFQDRALAAKLPAVPCPASAFVIVALGQSNAGNHLGPKVARDPALPAYAFFRDRCVHLQDPVPGATGEEGSLWTDLAHRLARRLGQPVVVIAAAAAGASVHDWHTDQAGIMTRAQRSLHGLGRIGLTPTAIVWLQGEADGEGRMTEAAYAARLEAVVARINAGIASASTTDTPPPRPAWIITQTSRCWGAASRSEAVRAAQRTVAARIPDGHAGPDTDALDETFRRDGCHFNENGRDRIASQLAAQIAEVVR